MQELTPQEIVAELDRFVIGQADAKRAVAVAIRNRWRRQQLPPETAADISPKNTILMGPTGVGKTEIARRLAKLTGAPFIKIEASKFTEVGYHGRDVESMIRDLVEQAVSMVRAEQAEQVKERAVEAAIDRVVNLLLPGSDRPVNPEMEDEADRRAHARERLRERVAAGDLDDREVEIVLTSRPQTNLMFANMGLDQMDPELSNVFERIIPEQSHTRRVKVRDAVEILAEEETEKLLDREKITTEALERAEQTGIIFLDEVDKIAGGGGGSDGRGPDVSRQGVQRDLLPIVEGSTVNTRYGMVKTDHILFIAAGAFHSQSVSDLMPELQGRFPIRVELSGLSRDDFVRILTEPDNALTKQQTALLSVEGLEVRFEPGAVETIADLAAQANSAMENIGARRLMTIVEKLFEQVSFDASERVAAGQRGFLVTEDLVRQQVGPVVNDSDLSKFVL